jgi:tRNA dimethylallyltransferase
VLSLDTYIAYMDKKLPLITILGPTATGKTILATHLALRIDGEIISADSRQVYRRMNLGTGKDLSDYQVNGLQVPYHLIDICEPGTKYNVFEYQADFLKAYNDINQRNKSAILCGGTGMYIESVLKGYEMTRVPINETLRNELESLTLEELAIRLGHLKPVHNNSDTDTKKRAIRAIEIAEFQKQNPGKYFDFPEIKSIVFGIDTPRRIIVERIDRRLKQRLREGMIDEVQALLDSGIKPEDLIYYGLEYKFITKFLLKEFSYNYLVEHLAIAIHQFAKRQSTWFRKMERDGFNIHWIDGELPLDDKLKQIMQVLDQDK